MKGSIGVLWARLATPEAQQGGECWPWPGSRNAKGYGTTKRNGENIASRAVWVHLHGLIPAGMQVCHHCDNPPCVRPSHLFLGLPRDNTRDMLSKGRHVAPRSLDNGRAKLSDDDVEAIRAAGRAGESRASIGRRLGLHPSYVGRILGGERRAS